MAVERDERDAAELEAGYTTDHRAYELGGIIGAVVLAGLAARPHPRVHAPFSGWWVTLAAFVGILAADFTSGFVHWMFDTWGSVDTPIVRPDRDPHVPSSPRRREGDHAPRLRRDERSQLRALAPPRYRRRCSWVRPDDGDVVRRLHRHGAARPRRRQRVDEPDPQVGAPGRPTAGRASFCSARGSSRTGAPLGASPGAAPPELLHHARLAQRAAPRGPLLRDARANHHRRDGRGAAEPTTSARRSRRSSWRRSRPGPAARRLGTRSGARRRLGA